MDTPSIDELAGEAFDSLETPDEVVEPQEEQETEVQPTEREVKADETEESFTKVNPNELSEELKQVYKMLQADYTKKRQTEAERVKKLEAQLEEARAIRQPQIPQEESEEDRVRKLVVAQQEELWDRQAQVDYTSLDERLNENDPITYDELLDSALRLDLTTKLDAYVDETGSKIGFDYKKVSKDFVEKWDKYIESLNKAYIQKQTQRAKENADKLKKQQPIVKSTEGVKTGKMKIDDAIEAAYDEAN